MMTGNVNLDNVTTRKVRIIENSDKETCGLVHLMCSLFYSVDNKNI